MCVCIYIYIYIYNKYYIYIYLKIYGSTSMFLLYGPISLPLSIWGGGTLLPLDDREVREARDHAGHFSVSLVTSECPAQSLTQTKGSMKV